MSGLVSVQFLTKVSDLVSVQFLTKVSGLVSVQFLTTVSGLVSAVSYKGVWLGLCVVSIRPTRKKIVFSLDNGSRSYYVNKFGFYLFINKMLFFALVVYF